MKVYKLLHKPTGMFFKPSKHRSKSNLSKTGKMYDRKPSLNYLGSVYHHPLTRQEWEAKYPKDGGYSWRYRFEGYEARPVIATDWEIVEFSLN